MAVAMTGHQTRHRKSTKAERRAIFERTAPDSWKQMSTDELTAAISKKENGGSLRGAELKVFSKPPKAKAKPRRKEAAINFASLCEHPKDGKVFTEGYDPNCGMEHESIWITKCFQEACTEYAEFERTHPPFSAIEKRAIGLELILQLMAHAYPDVDFSTLTEYWPSVPTPQKPKPITDERPPTVQPAPKERHIVTPEPNNKPIDWSEERARCDEAWRKKKAQEDAEKEKQISRDDLPLCKRMGIICPPSTEEMRVRQMSRSTRFWDEMYQKQDGWTAQNEKLFACKRDRYPTKEMAG